MAGLSFDFASLRTNEWFGWFKSPIDRGSPAEGFDVAFGIDRHTPGKPDREGGKLRMYPAGTAAATARNQHTMRFVMHTKPAGMAQCVTCQYWGGERQQEAPDQITFANPYATAACQNPASTLYRGQVQPIAVCNHWNKWQQP